TILLDVHDPGAEAARRSLAAFAELEKSPEHVHTYRISALSLWNAASAGLSADEILASLDGHSRYPLPGNLVSFIRTSISRYGSIVLYETNYQDILYLHVLTPALAAELRAHPRLKNMWSSADAIDGLEVRVAEGRPEPTDRELGFLLPLLHRGTIKQVLIGIGYP